MRQLAVVDDDVREPLVADEVRDLLREVSAGVEEDAAAADLVGQASDRPEQVAPGQPVLVHVAGVPEAHRLARLLRRRPDRVGVARIEAVRDHRHAVVSEAEAATVSIEVLRRVRDHVVRGVEHPAFERPDRAVVPPARGSKEHRLLGPKVPEVGDPPQAERVVEMHPDEVRALGRRGRQHDADPLLPDDPSRPKHGEGHPAHEVVGQQEEAFRVGKRAEQLVVARPGCTGEVAQGEVGPADRLRAMDLQRARVEPVADAAPGLGLGLLRDQHDRLDPELRQQPDELVDPAPAGGGKLVDDDEDLRRAPGISRGGRLRHAAPASGPRR